MPLSDEARLEQINNSVTAYQSWIKTLKEERHMIETMRAFLRGEMSEGVAAFSLTIDRLTLRERMEHRYGADWRA